MKKELRKEKKDHQADISKVTVLLAQTVELEKKEEVTSRAKDELDRKFRDLRDEFNRLKVTKEKAHYDVEATKLKTR